VNRVPRLGGLKESPTAQHGESLIELPLVDSLVPPERGQAGPDLLEAQGGLEHRAVVEDAHDRHAQVYNSVVAKRKRSGGRRRHGRGVCILYRPFPGPPRRDLRGIGEYQTGNYERES
jgi:hypothetical protein